MRLKILKNKMLMLRYENELCQRYLLLKLMPILAIYKNAVHHEHSVVYRSSEFGGWSENVGSKYGFFTV